MEAIDQMDEDQLINYAIRLSIQDTCKFPLLRSIESFPTASDEYLRVLTAIEEGDAFSLKGLSRFSFAFKERDNRGWLPMHVAAVQPLANVLDIVLIASHELTMEEKTADGETALILATRAGFLENVNILLQHGASPHNTNDKNETALLLAVRNSSYDIVQELLIGGAFVNQVCLKSWTATHEAAKVGCCDVLMLLLRQGGHVNGRDGHRVTPLGVAAEYAHPDVLQILVAHGGDVTAQAANGDSVLYDASGSGNLDCMNLLLEHGANPNVASMCSQLPIHRAAYEGHYLALKTLIPITTKRAVRISGMSPVHSAADGGHADCLQLLIEHGFDVNPVLATFISEKYGDMRRSALYFAVSNGDVTCAETLLRAGARPDQDPLRCLMVSVRARRYELTSLLLKYGADINCYFTALYDTVFPTALQYCLGDEMMMRLLLNNGYDAESCFRCHHREGWLEATVWKEVHAMLYSYCADPEKLAFCDFIGVPSMAHSAGRVVQILLDYVRHVPLCHRLQTILEHQQEWPEICHTLRNPRSLQHQCRLVIRKHMTTRRLSDPEFMETVPFPPTIKNYLIYKEYDLYGNM
ncbi:hypothetical protein AALO_G00227340 [Alosa alosa]|uniref:SOCS box domain-containing protein n=1 Tax=Alosa alosa TaxID=278164 RepID=A0AAV6G5J5_9TELE|nr:ankyrin repeat and SOCS box protein 15b [Alosa alosa]XP_048124281.1 ankyrin repeat and SOCS box protein 15b [Alosa alosa]XP_048124282.1 ankyrin repeat and SOCS box protein 15b [Alosa alosa]KAG5267911.1 hypothetical protein AALO_G00227340 [Alosa alosa]